MTANRYQALTVVPDAEGYILGRRGADDFVAVPEIGGQVILWLQAGVAVDDCAARASEAVGQDVDVADFLADLTAAGILTEDAEPPPPERPPPGHRIGRVFFGPVALGIQAALVVAGIVLLVSDPALRPSYHDGVPFAVPLVSIFTVTTVSLILTIIHELAHKLAAAWLGVYGRISFGRRLFFLVAQTDVTGLWVLPRWKRVIPLVAGMLVDGAIAAAFLILQETAGNLGSPTTEIVRAAVLVNVGGIIGQLEVYMRTDFYAVFLVVTGRKNLWAMKGAVARRLIRRPSAEDAELLAAAGPKDIFWARFYLVLYLPGVAVATWYFVVFRLQAMVSMLRLSWAALDGGVWSAAGGVLAIVLIVVPTGIGLLGAGRSAVRTVRELARVSSSPGGSR
ncbi:hypothetical protein [Actinocrispum wychmicini]|nr:hypothetical protein [Actinocrispum wychmicini]